MFFFQASHCRCFVDRSDITSALSARKRKYGIRLLHAATFAAKCIWPDKIHDARTPYCVVS